MRHIDSICTFYNQRAAALITALVLLVILTLLGLSSIGTTTMEERMAANAQESTRAFQAAATGLEMVYNDPDAFNVDLTAKNDGTKDDRYDKNSSVGSKEAGSSYNAKAKYNSVFQQSSLPPRGSGWDSSFAYYYFDLSSTGTTDTSAKTTLHTGAYQVGKK